MASKTFLKEFDSQKGTIRDREEHIDNKILTWNRKCRTFYHLFTEKHDLRQVDLAQALLRESTFFRTTFTQFVVNDHQKLGL